MRLIALIRAPSESIAGGERTHVERMPIDLARAREQHAAYAKALKDACAHIIEVPAAPELPDAVFIEDTALVLDPIAVLARPGAASRRAELPAVANALSHFRHFVSPPVAAQFDGGDVLQIGSTIYIGRTTRTNQAAIDYLTTLLRQYHYTVVTVPVSGCLHLKTAVTHLGHNSVLINPDWLSRDVFARHAQIEVHPDEPMGANALYIGSQLLMSASYPRTARRVEAHGLEPRLIDISEFHRAEGGLTCLSILLQSSRPA